MLNGGGGASGDWDESLELTLQLNSYRRLSHHAQCHPVLALFFHRHNWLQGFFHVWLSVNCGVPVGPEEGHVSEGLVLGTGNGGHERFVPLNRNGPFAWLKVNNGLLFSRKAAGLGKVGLTISLV